MEEEKGFELKITQEGCEDIYINTENISSVEFFVDTVDDNVKDRSENVVNKVTIKGEISEEIKLATKELLLWSLAKRREEIYRKAEITVRINETSRVRKYTMDKVFCIDYKETFSKEEKNKYELTFSQRKDNSDGIKIIC